MKTPNTLTNIVSTVSCNTPGFAWASHSIKQRGSSTRIRNLLWASAFSMLLAVAAQAQNTFVYTNDDVASGNTVSGFLVASNGVLTAIPGSPFPTGGTGTGFGLFAANRVTLSTVGRFLYAANTGSGSVGVFSINPISGLLAPVPGSPFSTGGSPGDLSLAVTADNKFLFCGNDFSSTISVFAIASNGSLSPVPGSPFAAGGAIDGISVTPDGRFLSAAMLFGGPTASVAMFSISSNGALAAVPGSPFAGPGAVEITGIDINCASNLLFAANATGGPTVVNVFNIASAGVLTSISGSPFTFGGLNSNVPFLSPNEKFLFVSNQFSNANEGSITVLNVAANGSLTEVAGSPFANPGGVFPCGLGTDTAGKFLFVGNRDNVVSVFSIANNGVLTPAPGSPFVTGQAGGLSFLAVYPGKSCGSHNSFNTCMKDNATGDILAFDSVSGAYQYTRCSDGFSIAGTGAVRSVGGVLSLTDNRPDRRISAGFLTGQLTGNATIMFSVAQGVWQTFSIHDTTSFGKGCSCGK